MALPPSKSYDGNGNMIEERAGGHGTSTVLAGSVYTVGDVSMTDTGFGLDRGTTTDTPTSATYARYFSWDEENRLVRSVDNNITVQYSYGADGQRAVKYSKRGESLYFDSMWSCQTDIPSMRQLKNIFVGQTRIATRLSLQDESSTGYEKVNTYYYHPDHLGSAQLVTDYEGDIYERIEYTPYGETWIERTSDGLDLIPFRFTGKELDSETGLYYYGARYLNPRSSMWLSADPALGDYIPVAPVSDEARKHNQNLAGMGGVFNLINLAVYHYAANNPVKYTDPNGRETAEQLRAERIKAGPAQSGGGACLYGTLLGAAQEYVGKNLTQKQMDTLKATLGKVGPDGKAAVDFSDFQVNKSAVVIIEALKLLTGKDYNVTIMASSVATDEFKGKAQYTVRVLPTGHKQLGDSKGKFLWESLSYLSGDSSPSIKKDDTNNLRYIFIEPKEGKE